MQTKKKQRALIKSIKQLIINNFYHYDRNTNKKIQTIISGKETVVSIIPIHVWIKNKLAIINSKEKSHPKFAFLVIIN